MGADVLHLYTEAAHWKTKEGLVRGCACRGTAGVAHMSCLAEQAKILLTEAEENNLDWAVKNVRWARWHMCSLCEQHYYGVVKCALGWACWKTYVGRPETDQIRGMAMTQLGNGLYDANHYEDALPVYEAELATLRRVGTSEDQILVVQSNLASAYQALGRTAEALGARRDVYAGTLKRWGKEHEDTLTEAGNYAGILVELQRFKEAKKFLRKTLPVTQRVLGENDETTLRLRWNYAEALYDDPGATLNDLREAVTTLEETERTARRVLGGAHPVTKTTEDELKKSRAKLGARETPPGSA